LPRREDCRTEAFVADLPSRSHREGRVDDLLQVAFSPKRLSPRARGCCKTRRRKLFYSVTILWRSIGVSDLVRCNISVRWRSTGGTERGIANNEIDRPKSLCIRARYQRPVVESSFCEMRSWLVLRSKREPLHSRRLWRLKVFVCHRRDSWRQGAHHAVARGAVIYNRMREPC
jgi:hypothetical protein